MPAPNPKPFLNTGTGNTAGSPMAARQSNQPRGIGEAGMLQLASNQADAMNLDHALSWLSVDGSLGVHETFGFDS